jgi:hypothetical protein
LDVHSVTTDANGYSYVSSYWGTVSRSTDGGKTWTNSSGFRFPSSPTQLLAANGKLYVGTYWHGVYVSEDRAEHWTPRTNGFPANTNSPHVKRGVWAVALLGDQRVVCLGRDQLGVHGLYRANDAGDAWERNDDGISADQIRQLDFLGRGGAGAVYAWGPGILFRQSPQSQNWTPVSLPDGFSVLCVAPSPGDGTLVGTAQGGVYHRAEDSAGWTKLGDARLNNLRVQALSVGGYGTVYAGTDNGVFSLHPNEWIPATNAVRTFLMGETRNRLEFILFGYAGQSYETFESNDLTSWRPSGNVKYGIDRAMRWEMVISPSVPRRFLCIRASR